MASNLTSSSLFLSSNPTSYISTQLCKTFGWCDTLPPYAEMFDLCDIMFPTTTTTETRWSTVTSLTRLTETETETATVGINEGIRHTVTVFAKPILQTVYTEPIPQTAWPLDREILILLGILIFLLLLAIVVPAIYIFRIVHVLNRRNGADQGHNNVENTEPTIEPMAPNSTDYPLPPSTPSPHSSTQLAHTVTNVPSAEEIVQAVLAQPRFLSALQRPMNDPGVNYVVADNVVSNLLNNHRFRGMIDRLIIRDMPPMDDMAAEVIGQLLEHPRVQAMEATLARILASPPAPPVETASQSHSDCNRYESSISHAAQRQISGAAASSAAGLTLVARIEDLLRLVKENAVFDFRCPASKHAVAIDAATYAAAKDLKEITYSEIVGKPNAEERVIEYEARVIRTWNGVRAAIMMAQKCRGCKVAPPRMPTGLKIRQISFQPQEPRPESRPEPLPKQEQLVSAVIERPLSKGTQTQEVVQQARNTEKDVVEEARVAKNLLAEVKLDFAKREAKLAADHVKHETDLARQVRDLKDDRSRDLEKLSNHIERSRDLRAEEIAELRQRLEKKHEQEKDDLRKRVQEIQAKQVPTRPQPREAPALRQQIQELQAEIARAQQAAINNAALQEELQKTKADKDTEVARVRDLTFVKVKQLQTERDGLVGQNKSLLKEQQQLKVDKDQIAQQQGQLQEAAQTVQQETAIREAQHQRELQAQMSLVQNLQAQATQASSRAQPEQELQKQRAAIESLQAQLTQASSQAKPEQELQTQRAAVESLQAQLTQASSQAQSQTLQDLAYLHKVAYPGMVREFTDLKSYNDGQVPPVPEALRLCRNSDRHIAIINEMQQQGAKTMALLMVPHDPYEGLDQQRSQYTTLRAAVDEVLRLHTAAKTCPPDCFPSSTANDGQPEATAMEIADVKVPSPEPMNVTPTAPQGLTTPEPVEATAASSMALDDLPPFHPEPDSDSGISGETVQTKVANAMRAGSKVTTAKVLKALQNDYVKKLDKLRSIRPCGADNEKHQAKIQQKTRKMDGIRLQLDKLEVRIRSGPAQDAGLFRRLFELELQLQATTFDSAAFHHRECMPKLRDDLEAHLTTFEQLIDADEGMHCKFEPHAKRAGQLVAYVKYLRTKRADAVRRGMLDPFHRAYDRLFDDLVRLKGQCYVLKDEIHASVEFAGKHEDACESAKLDPNKGVAPQDVMEDDEDEYMDPEELDEYRSMNLDMFADHIERMRQLPTCTEPGHCLDLDEVRKRFDSLMETRAGLRQTQINDMDYACLDRNALLRQQLTAFVGAAAKFDTMFRAARFHRKECQTWLAGGNADASMVDSGDSDPGPTRWPEPRSSLRPARRTGSLKLFITPEAKQKAMAEEENRKFAVQVAHELPAPVSEDSESDSELSSCRTPSDAMSGDGVDNDAPSTNAANRNPVLATPPQYFDKNPPARPVSESQQRRDRAFGDKAEEDNKSVMNGRMRALIKQFHPLASQERHPTFVEDMDRLRREVSYFGPTRNLSMTEVARSITRFRDFVAEMLPNGGMELSMATTQLLHELLARFEQERQTYEREKRQLPKKEMKNEMKSEEGAVDMFEDPEPLPPIERAEPPELLTELPPPEPPGLRRPANERPTGIRDPRVEADSATMSKRKIATAKVRPSERNLLAQLSAFNDAPAPTSRADPADDPENWSEEEGTNLLTQAQIDAATARVLLPAPANMAPHRSLQSPLNPPYPATVLPAGYQPASSVPPVLIQRDAQGNAIAPLWQPHPKPAKPGPRH